MINKPIVVIGAGSWGTALAILLARNNQPTRLWGWKAEEMALMQASCTNERYLPNIPFPAGLTIYTDLALALKGDIDILLAVPSYALRATFQAMLPHLCPRNRIVLASKGIDPESGQLLHEVITSLCPWDIPVAVLSGPSFAREVAIGLPTAVTIASSDSEFVSDLMQRFYNSAFRPYASDDVIGVEIAGAVKNVIAIAVGVSDGLGFGANTRCAIITRGLAEIVRLGMAMGGKQKTFLGLSGVGDLILTCTDNQSRNRRFGLAVGQGITQTEAQKQIGQVVEGINNATQIFHLAQKHHVDMPITEQVYQVLHHHYPARDAVNTLLSREMKGEGF
jgi:glycerol-3-phosphate dehydrogenase (NAD(P)+)